MTRYNSLPLLLNQFLETYMDELNQYFPLAIYYSKVDRVHQVS